MSQVNILIWVLLVLLLAGVALAALNSSPSAFWATIGFVLVGSALGGLVAIFVVNAVVRRIGDNADDEVRLRLLRSIGGDSKAAINRLCNNIHAAPQGGFTFRGHELDEAWRLIVGRELSPEGFHDEVHDQHAGVTYRGRSADESFVVLDNRGMDLDVGLMMVTRALGRAYARIDLFEPEELPINDLQQAAQLMEDGRKAGTLDGFQASSMVSALAHAVERCGTLLQRLVKSG